MEVTLETQGEIEAAISEGISRFEQELMGRGPKDIHSYLIDDLVVIRLVGVLTAAEQYLVQSLSSEKGRGLLRQVRIQLIEAARPVLESMVPHSCVFSTENAHVATKESALPILPGRVLGNIRYSVVVLAEGGF